MSRKLRIRRAVAEMIHSWRQASTICPHTARSRIIGITEPSCILRHHIQDRLDVSRGAGDYPENFARRGLLFQGF